MLADRPRHSETRPKFALLVVGRLQGLTRRRLREVVQQVGGELVSRPTARLDVIAVAHSAARAMLHEAPPLAIPPALRGPKFISEMTLKRMLRLVPAAVADDRTLDQADVIRGSKLSAKVLECLVAFDVLDPVGGKFAYQDVLIAREVKRLLDLEYQLATIVEASSKLRRSRASLAGVRLVEAPWGEIVQELSGVLASLDGQFALPLSHKSVKADDLFERAEIAEASGDLVTAERFYRAALAVDRTDAAIPYNLANVLDAQGRRDEAVLAYYQALQRDSEFAEAWFNLGVIEEEKGRIPQAITHYWAAVSVQPNFADALFNLALLLTEEEIFDEATRLWERFIALSPHGPDTARAKRCATLCRLAQTALARQITAKGNKDQAVCGARSEELPLC